MPRIPKTGLKGLYKEPDDRGGQWRIDLRWRDARTLEPRRHTERLPPDTPAAAAKARVRSILAGALSGTIGERRSIGSPQSLRKAFDDYLDWVEGAGAGEYVDPKRARRDKAGHFDAWIDAVGDLPLASLGVATFDKFKAHEAKRGVGPATVNRRLGTMKHFLARAASNGWIAKARALELRSELRSLPEPDARVRWLSDDERARLDASLPQELRAVVEAAAYSGLRLSSVIGILKSDVDLKARSLSVWAKRKGQRKRLVVPVNDVLAGIVETAMARSKGAHVFVNRRGKPYTMSGVSGLFRKVVARAKIKDLHFHDLRHDFATRLRRADVPVENIKELLGHADVKTTMRYAHVGAAALHAAVAKLTRVASGSKQRPKSPERRRQAKSP